MAAPGGEAACGLCGAAGPPYTCPRCNRRLCSLGCYRGHGGCAEAFYREQVLRALEAERGSPPGGARLQAAFRRLRRLREAGDPAGPAGRHPWEGLGPAEREGFRRLLGSGGGAAALLLPPWRPWWWRGRRRAGEEEEEEEGGEEGAVPGPPPPLPAAVPPLSSLPAPPPSPLLPFQLPNVLYGYAFALSLHAGDEALLPELPAAALDVSAALRTRRPFASAAQALAAARRDALAAGYPLCPLGEAGTVLAVAELLEGREAGGGGDAARALAHLAELLRKGSRALPAAAEAEEERRRFGRARRKCRYLLAWSREAGAAAALAGLAAEARRLHAELAGEEAAAAAAAAAGELVTGRADEGPGGRRLIEELD